MPMFAMRQQPRTQAALASQPNPPESRSADPASGGSKGYGSGDVVVHVENVTKRFRGSHAVDGVSLDVRRGELLTLLGPSGCGKTTLLRMVAGLIRPDGGAVVVDGKDVAATPAHDLGIGLVFQSLALFPHLSVVENVQFPLRMRRVAPRERAARATNALAMVGLPNLADASVSSLSGGQRQRVALARALIYEPAVLLLDEPFSALDRRLKETMQLEIASLHSQLDVTIIHVTHDQREAFLLSDRIAVMERGRIVQVDKGTAIHRAPATEFVAAFLGDPLLLDGTLTTTGFRHGNTNLAAVSTGSYGPAKLVLRPEALVVRSIDDSAPVSGMNMLPGRVVFAAFDGAGMFVEVELLDQQVAKIQMSADSASRLVPGERVRVLWDPADAPVVAPGEAKQ